MKPETAETNTKKTAGAGTIRLHRVLKAPPERVYKAVLNKGSSLCLTTSKPD